MEEKLFVDFTYEMLGNKALLHSIEKNVLLYCHLSDVVYVKALQLGGKNRFVLRFFDILTGQTNSVQLKLV